MEIRESGLVLNFSPLTPRISIMVASNAVVPSANEVKTVLLTEVRSCNVGLSKQAEGLGCSFSRGRAFAFAVACKPTLAIFQ